MNQWNLPLLAITTVKNCSVNCYPYCPQLKFREVYGDRGNILSYADFETALSHTPKEVTIGFEGFAEPFLNSRCMDMIELTKKEGHRIMLFSTFVGAKPDDIKRLRDVNLDWFCLHLPDDQGIAQIPLTDTYKETLAQAFRTLRIDDYSRMTSTFISNQRAGNCEGAPPHHVRGPFYCTKLVKPEPLMLPNCDLVLCCMDWTMRHVLGNLKKQTFDEITHSEIYKEIASNRWKMDGTTLCRSCRFAWSLPKKAVYEVGRKGYLFSMDKLNLHVGNV